MIYKKKIINFLFLLSFPLYGIGFYIAAAKSPSAGHIIAIVPYFLIFAFYLLDIFYKREFQFRVNHFYLVALVFLLSAVGSLFIALHDNLPDVNSRLIILKALLFLLPFHAFVVVCLYNEKTNLPRLALTGLSLLLLINIVGYFGLGISNELHQIEDRINFPFLGGLYSAAGLIAVINLMLLYYMNRALTNPARMAGLILYFAVNLLFLFLINSRLMILIFLIVFILFFFRLPKKSWTLFIISLFTLPILLNSGLLLYRILSLPVFASVLQRIDVVDVTTFHGRSFIWQDTINWITDDGRGLLFGNGYRGHYFLEILSDVARLWSEEDLHHLHLHSTSLEILVNQGLFGLVLFLVLFYRVLRYYEGQNRAGTNRAAFFPVAVFLLFVMQIDGFVFMENFGFIVFSFMLARAVVKQKPLSTGTTGQRVQPAEITFVLNGNGNGYNKALV